jgi:hypothetical protein
MLLEFVRSYRHSQEVLQPTQELIDHIRRFSTSFESVSAMISCRQSERARYCCLVFWFLRVNHKLYLHVLVPWSLGDLPANHRPSSLIWSGDDGFVRGTCRPPSFMEKLLSGKRHQGDWGLHKSLVVKRPLIKGD